MESELTGLWTRLEGASRLWWLVVLAAIAGAVAGAGYGYRASPEVVAKASIVFRPASVEQRFVDSLSTTAMGTERELASDQEVLVKVVEATGVDAQTLPDRLSADVPENSNVLILTASDTSEEGATTLAEAYATAYLEFRSSLDSADTQPVAERTGPARIPESQRPSVIRMAAFGGVLGTVIGLIGALWVASRDDRLRGRRTISEALPDSPIWARVSNTSTYSELGLAAATLMAHLEPREGRSSIAVIAGATGSDRTSDTVRGIAEALTDRGLRVLTVRMGGGGPAEVTGRLALTAMTEERPGRWWSLDHEALPMGVGSSRLHEAARQLGGRIDVILVAASDASRSRPTREAIAEADVVVLVARHGVTRTPEIAAARESIELLGTRVHGLIVLGVPARGRNYRQLH